ncbi:MAG: hypothetical protein V1856_00465 [Candidatus Liptonbacteria bacterium]
MFRITKQDKEEGVPPGKVEVVKGATAAAGAALISAGSAIKNFFGGLGRKKTIYLIGVLILIAFFILWWTGSLPGPLHREIPDPDANLMSNRNAYDIALLAAQQWDAQAKLHRLTSYPNKTGVTGRSDDWDSVFVSPDKKGLAYRVSVRNRQIASVQEFPLTEQGGELPQDTITSKEAIARFRKIPGNETIPIISVEMMYGPDGEVWYWSIQTSRGWTAIDAK